MPWQEEVESEISSFSVPALCIWWRRGRKFQRNKLSTLANSQEQVLSNQTKNKYTHTLVQGMTHYPLAICLCCQYLSPSEEKKIVEAKGWLLKASVESIFESVHIPEKCVIQFQLLRKGFQGSAHSNLMNCPPLLTLLSHCSLVIHPLGC